MTRIAVIEREKCNPVKCGKLCARLCPVNRMGEECIRFVEKARIDEVLCTGCGICPKRCPYQAIHIINLPEEMTQQPVHQYGENMFRLYSLPIPQFSRVVGIIGKNGIGKSTSLSIVAQVLRPNLGNWESTQTDINRLIEFYRGTEAQNFFEKLRDREIVASYKPQAVDSIPRHYKGTVRKLLSGIDTEKSYKDIAEELEIANVLDTDIDQISGGELQRVAIAAAVLRKSNLVIFDEPASYLDIKQRLRMGNFIKRVADEGRGVLLVEHDILILDYMTDFIHIMYGKPACYGVVSMPRPTKAGINTFLDGYLKEENIRFRDYPIKFSSHPPVQSKIEKKVVIWEQVEKKLGGFRLNAESGFLPANSVIGVIGENGIGKTTFVKILAGVIEHDKGNISENLTVSYKPQYLESESEENVENLLSDCIANYSAELIRPLQLDELMSKKVNTLSGGELQKVSIALCLSREAGLYLLDEPSAHLDIEQRFIVAKLIKELTKKREKCCLVVDHDLIFIDAISDWLMVFEGSPAVEGNVSGPYPMEEGMNRFLSRIGITMRRDELTERPRINKPGSVKDREQKERNRFYYA